MPTYLAILLMFAMTMSHCHAQTKDYQPLFEEINTLAARYKSGDFNIRTKTDSVISEISFQSGILPILFDSLRKSDNEFKKYIFINSIGQIVRHGLESGHDNRDYAIDSLLSCIDRLGSFELISLVYSQVVILEQKAVPVLIGNLRHPNILVRKWSIEFLVRLTGKKELKYDVSSTEGSLSWSNWWSDNSQKVKWNKVKKMVEDR